MDLRLFSIENAPRTLPIWDLILDDLGRPPPERVAKVLGVGRSTVFRWTAEGRAPRMACLALFWLTRWGHSEVDCRATNDAMLAVSLARSLHEERTKLRAELEEVSYERQRLQGMVSRLSQIPGRGNGSSACLSDTDRATGAWLGVGLPPLAAPMPPPVQAPALGWPELAPQTLPDWPTLDVAGAAQATGPACVDRGSPAGPPPGVHSGRCPSDPHRRQPQLSGPQGASQSSPSSPLDCHHSDAIMASPQTGSPQLFGMGQAPAPALPAAGGALRTPARVRSGSAPTAAPGTDAEGAPPECSLQGANGPTRDARTVTRVVAGRVASRVRPEVARPARSAVSQLRGLNDPSDGATPHTPPPRAASAAPGASAFEALTATLTHPAV